MKELSKKECQEIAGGNLIAWGGQILRGVITIVLANIINRRNDKDKDKGK